MKKLSHDWVLYALGAAAVASYLLAQFLDLPPNSWNSFFVRVFIVITLFVAMVGIIFRLTQRPNLPAELSAVLASVAKNKRRPLFLYGVILILLSIFWASITPKFVDPNSTTSIFVIFGGMIILSSAGFALILYRIWTRVRDFIS